jgi:hypothetical protein
MQLIGFIDDNTICGLSEDEEREITEELEEIFK